MRALSLKLISDADDVLYDMTRHNGDQLWTQSAWTDFLPRLFRWMTFFEETGRRNGLTPHSGHMLGTKDPGIADLATATLWGTMTGCFPSLQLMLTAKAPAVAGLTDRISSLPSQAALRRHSRDAFGDTWCGGQIEASLRAVV